MFDQMQFLFQEYNDHQLHGVIIFVGRLDRDCLKKAVILSMDLVPILRSRYVERAWHPFWESTGLGYDDVVTFVASNCLKEEIDRFLTGRTDECQGPQLMVRIVSSQAQDVLCIVMNHMICDGAGFKEYLYLLVLLSLFDFSPQEGMEELLVAVTLVLGLAQHLFVMRQRWQFQLFGVDPDQFGAGVHSSPPPTRRLS
jgi:hypothetical protein